MKTFILALFFCLLTTLAFPDQIFIQVRFREETPHGQYNDALYFTPEEYDKVEQETIDILKQERIDNWIYAVTHPAPYVEPTLEELKFMEVELTMQLDEIKTKIAILEPIK